jgi:uncharacterized membrane protein
VHSEPRDSASYLLDLLPTRASPTAPCRIHDLPRDFQKILATLAETFVSYLISLAVSYGFLQAYGHVSVSSPLDIQLAATVVLGYVTTLGAAAGRVLVAEQ